MVILKTFVPPDAPILCQNENTKAIIDGVDLGNGTVFINERKLAWKDEHNSGFSIEFPHISLHAITTDPNVYQTKCLFIMIDNTLSIHGYESPQQLMEDANDEESDGDESVSENTSRVLLVPSDSDTINPLFSALSLGQSLNPDPQDSMEEEEEDDDIYGDAEDTCNGYGSMHTNSGLNHLSMGMRNVSIHYESNGDQENDDNQFADAD
ncbi:hypothetical protein RI129_010534 [Pyrocoelia pectoralis]|uniref:Methylosome subunit pICln n=1 Tax=Pyrocoelia pectoralis TaxID=417401 RepID=A0AAN7V632_9COLE